MIRKVWNQLVLAIGAFVFSQSIVDAESQKRNVLLLNIDDLKPTLSCYGDTVAVTPNIDALAAKGTIFQRAYCQQAVCSASRVSMFTGMRPDTTGVLDLKTYMRDINPLAVTLPQWFKKNGFHSIGYGKTLHGAKANDPRSWTKLIDKPELPYNSEFPRPVLEKFQAPEIHAIQGKLKEGKKRVKTSKLTTSLKKAGVYTAVESLELPDSAYTDGAIADAAIYDLSSLAESKEPFLMVVGFCKPHLPFNAPKKYWDLYNRENMPLHPYQDRKIDRAAYAYHNYGELANYDGYELGKVVKPAQQRELIHGYYACVSYVDVQIGRVLKKLKETGLDQNTIVVLWGDHGWHLGDHGLWCKHSNYEQATRTPLIIVTPEGKASQSTESLAEVIDIFPTVCDFAGLKKPNGLEGTSLLPVLSDPLVEVKGYAMSQYTRSQATGYSLRSGNYRYTLWMDRDFISFDSFDTSLVKSGELYDYNKDQHERVNHYGVEDYSSIQNELHKKMLSYFADVHSPKQGKRMKKLIEKHRRD